MSLEKPLSNGFAMVVKEAVANNSQLLSSTRLLLDDEGEVPNEPVQLSPLTGYAMMFEREVILPLL